MNLPGSQPWIITAGIALASSFVGALIAIFSEPIRKWIFSLWLVAEFRGDTDDFIVRTPVRPKNPTGQVVEHEAYGVRGFVRNTGSTARWLLRMAYEHRKEKFYSGAFDQTRYHEIIPLQWSNCPNEKINSMPKLPEGWAIFRPPDAPPRPG